VNVRKYPFFVKRLENEEGVESFSVELHDLPDCVAQGATVEEAVANVYKAAESWIEEAGKEGRDVPTPSTEVSGEWTQKAPKSLHSRMIERAKSEAVDLNTLVVTYLSQGLTRDKAAAAKPERSFSDRPPRRDFGDRPPRRDFGDRPPRRDFGDRPPRRDFGDRPPRSDFGGDSRPPRRDFGGDSRPPRRDFGSDSRPPRRDFGGDSRPPRRDFGNSGNFGR
jgi:predicted RNase H-like HicB family nuclease